MTSEQEYGLPDQPKDTCPIINNALKSLKKMARDVPSQRQIRNADEEELRAMLEELISDTDYHYSDIENAFEECRQQAIDIREWGQAWKDLAKQKIEIEEQCSTLSGALKYLWKNQWYYNKTVTWIRITCFPVHKNPKYTII